MRSWRIFYTLKNKKGAVLCLVLCVMLLACIVFSLCLGAVRIPLQALWQILTGTQTQTPAARIVLYTRLPRCWGSILAGAALAVSGAVIQSVLTNPLAAPHIIGVNSGAGFAVTLCCVLFPTAVWLIPAAAFGGALLGVMTVITVSKKAGASRTSLVLVGIAVSQLFSAGIDALLTVIPDSLSSYTDFRIGGFSGVTTSRLWPAFWMIVLGLGLAVAMGGHIDILLLGPETAQSLGLPVEKVRFAALFIAAALAGAGVSFAGLLGFVGLIVPHAMRRFVGENSRILTVASALGGAVLVSFCDLVARTLFTPYEIPVGIVMSFIGGPFFLYLVFSRKGGHAHD